MTTPYRNNIIFKTFKPHDYSYFIDRVNNLEYVVHSNNNHIVDKDSNEWIS
jgi:hypothetical protein